MSRIEAVISDFGGVLTAPLLDSFAAFQEAEGISLEHLGQAMATLAARTGSNPLFELEKGKLSEAEFLRSMAEVLTEQLGKEVTLHEFGQRYFAHLEVNPPMIDYMSELKRRGYRLAICTNNVREWSERWRSMLPVDEIFDVVVDSGFVGTRKPEPEIYEITLQRLDVEPAAALFIDDVELNCQGAREVGLSAVWFRTNEQAIEEIEGALTAPSDQFSAPSRSQQ
jgi:epoxide hydrolase-like predicted phosphatase